MSALFLGVDAGSSKTVALVGDDTGTVRGRGRAGNGDIYGTETAEEAVLNVVTAVGAALVAAGAVVSDLRHAAFRLAGVDWPEDEDYWRRAIATQLPGLRSCSMKNDGYALLRCGDPSGVGVAITAGTGPAVAARGPGGEEVSASWWIQDLLGGRGLGFAAVAAVMDAELGLRSPTSLTSKLLGLYELPDAKALLHAFTRRDAPRPWGHKARAARAVLQASGEGDATAQEIVRSQARAFTGHARVAADRVGFDAEKDPVVVVLGGSILTSEHPALRDAMTDELLEVMPTAGVRLAYGSPLAGALLDAMAEGNLLVSSEVRDRVLQSWHPADFLLTD